MSTDSLKQQADEDQNAIESAMQAFDLADGTSTRIFRKGAGDPIICLPMVKELNFVYAPQIEDFGKEYQIILYEPRLSRTKRVGITDRAAEVILIMDMLGIERAHIVAWSDTGSPAYILARDWPQRCKSVVFLGLADRYHFPQPLQTLVKILERAPIEYFVPSALLARILSGYLGGEMVKPSWVAKRAAAIPRLTQLFKHSVLPNLVEHKPKRGEVKVPCLVVCGDEDALVTVDQAHRMADLLSAGSKAEIIPGGEHFLSYINFEAVNKSMRTFYGRLAKEESIPQNEG